MKSGRADHAICLFSQGDYQIVYVFGTSDTIEFLAIKNTQIEQINTMMRRENAGNYQSDRAIKCLLLEEEETGLILHSAGKSSLEWCVAKENLPIVLKPASCVLHFRSIYITGSHPFKQFKVYQYTPQLLPSPEGGSLRDSGSVTEYEIGQRVMKQPCALACWNALMVIFYRDGERWKGLKWDIGSSVLQTDACFDIAQTRPGEEDIHMLPLCPAITQDSKCFLLTESPASTYLFQYSFIKEKMQSVSLLADPSSI